MARKRISTLIGDITTITRNLSARLEAGEMQHLVAFHTELEAWLAEALVLESRQELQTARLRENSEQRRLVEARGVELRTRAGGHLLGHFGPKAKTLHEFGFRPRRPPRPAKLEQPAPEESPTPPAEPASSG